jgi:hypothetical protein
MILIDGAAMDTSNALEYMLQRLRVGICPTRVASHARKVFPVVPLRGCAVARGRRAPPWIDGQAAPPGKSRRPFRCHIPEEGTSHEQA